MNAKGTVFVLITDREYEEPEIAVFGTQERAEREAVRYVRDNYAAAVKVDTFKDAVEFLTWYSGDRMSIIESEVIL